MCIVLNFFSLKKAQDGQFILVKSTFHVDPAGQKPNTLDPDLVK